MTFTKGARRLGIVGLNATFLQLADGDFTGKLCVDLRQLSAVTGDAPADWFERHDLCLLRTH